CESGYRRAVETEGLLDVAEVVHAGGPAASGRAAAQTLLDRPRRPTAVVVANAVTAAGVLSGFRDASIVVPSEVSVVGIHNSWFLEHLAVALTTVDITILRLGGV